MDYSNLSNEELEGLVNKKDGEAICELGERCMYGIRDYEINLTRAAQLFHKGEKMGLTRAYIGLGEMYRKGVGFIKNEEIAREYYRKAGVSYPGDISQNIRGDAEQKTNQNTSREEFSNSSKMTGNSFANGRENTRKSGVSVSDIREKLNQAERLRTTENYNQAKTLCNEAVRLIEGVQSGIIAYRGTEDVEDVLIDAYWLMAYIAFNEQRYQEMENYLAKDGVQGLHPWGVYLATVSHKVVQSPDIMLEQDLQMLITVSNNQNLSLQEKGDVCAMIADLLQEGYGKRLGASPTMAKSYYEEAMNCGNEYAREQYKNMQ